ncbi:MAG: lanthionine synthetase C family protein [Candidatus Aminicenantes bacterium]|nr:lanthionine synthetase C family protein [Candidatus Aminicenantes bacterium]
MKKKWKKQVDAAQAAKYEAKLTEIAGLLFEEAKKMDGPSLMGGKSGAALFFFYYGKYTMKEKYVDYGLELLSDIFDEINEGFVYHTFAGGLAGIGWTVEHLSRVEFLDADTNEILGDLDSFLDRMMRAEIKEGNYDFLHAALGVGFYFLSRLNCPDAKGYLSALVDGLDKVSHKDEGGGIKWHSVLDHEKKLEGFNLSLSHGISSIIAILSRIYKQGINKEKTFFLLEGAVNYLLQQAQDLEKYSAVFPSWIAEPRIFGSRLGWCYGDLGNAITLWQAAQIAKNKEWEEMAVKTILHSTKRRDPANEYINDAGLCHGAIGVGHLYNRMYHYTGLEECRETALYWYENIFKLAVNEDGLAGYKTFRIKELGGPHPDSGFLEGISGIGLALISLLSDIEPQWDEALLMS